MPSREEQEADSRSEEGVQSANRTVKFNRVNKFNCVNQFNRVKFTELRGRVARNGRRGGTRRECLFGVRPSKWASDRPKRKIVSIRLRQISQHEVSA